ncbi:hypothetical protein [Streptomyces cellostaticus]|uniref:hypothetical protein n=1 Tax=Streptomyces cellostaticus TaxID=67285 RepID=UPI0020272FA7|nr:hypothetical protein [Streptomyces cellostaticus]
MNRLYGCSLPALDSLRRKRPPTTIDVGVCASRPVHSNYGVPDHAYEHHRARRD